MLDEDGFREHCSTAYWNPPSARLRMMKTQPLLWRALPEDHLPKDGRMWSSSLIARGRCSAGAKAAAAAGLPCSPLGPANLDAANKGDAGDWVTAFDVAAENAVRDVITAPGRMDTITGEEHGTTRPGQPSGYRWSIDPLDGTTNFIRNIVYYATSVAVADPDGVWLAGVVNAPALGRIYSAARGHGAWLEENGQRTQLTGPVLGRNGTDRGHRLQLRSRRPGGTVRRARRASWTASPMSAGSAPPPWTSASWLTGPTTPSENAGSTNMTSPRAH